MARNAFVPMSWICSELNGEALRTLILISTYADAETGECNPSNATLAMVLKKNERTVRNFITEIVSHGFLSIHEGSGKSRRFRIESPDWFPKPGRKTSGFSPSNPEEKLPGSGDQPGRKTSGLESSTRKESDRQPGRKTTGNPEEKLPGPNKNTLLNTFLNTEREEERSELEESKPSPFAEGIISSLSTLGQKPQPIPDKILRQAAAVGAEGWIGEVRFQEIDLVDWRVAETLTRLKARGGNKGSKYAWAIFRSLPEAQPVAVAPAAQAFPARMPDGLAGAEAGLALARQLVAKGEATQADVDRYEAKVEAIKRKAGML